MKPFRKNVAIAVDGGGIRGTIVARALSVLEDHLGEPCHEFCRLTAGTSTGAIISAGIAQGLTASRMHELYVQLADVVFPKTLRSALWPLTRYRYSLDPLRAALQETLGHGVLGDIWAADPPTDVVITLFDLVTKHTGFAKPWKPGYANWSLVDTVLASCTVPTFFPPVHGRYVDGGVGSYANPSYLAAYEARFYLDWDPNETTLLSFGTGRYPQIIQPGQASRLWAWQWLEPILGAFQQSADDQQVHLVNTFFPSLDFRRFQVEMREPIGMDGTDKIHELTAYGDEMGRKVLNDETETPIEVAFIKPARRP